jgi:7-carboxy-7-deazaguanine synthase
MELNKQPPEKVVRVYDGTVEVHSIFETIQGEGPFCGTPCVFVRLAGCSLQCPLCDTEYTSVRNKMTPNAIVAAVYALRETGLVVITGGEPFRQSIHELLNFLTADGYYVQVETNGTHAPPVLTGSDAFYERTVKLRDPKGVYIVCSPKTGFVHPALAARACCYKYVLSHDSVATDDGLPLTALGHAANPSLARPLKKCDLPIYLQPADVQDIIENQKNMNAVVDSALKHGYIVQSQMHKILGLA